jgi:hypothetical protein
MNKRYQVFVSSTYSDLKQARAKVLQSIIELDCIPSGMELFPAIDEEQFEFIKKIIDDCDYYLLIIGGRYGSLSSDGISYTEKEYDYAIEKNINVIAFIHGNPDEIPLGKSEKDNLLREKLEIFKKKVATKRLIKYWNHEDELPSLVALSLYKIINTYPAIGWIRSDAPADPELYKQLSELQRENQELKKLVLRTDNRKKESIDSLANMEDLIKLSGTHRHWDIHSKRDIITSWEIEITWKQLFTLFSPYLLNYPHDGSAKSHLSSVIYSLTPDPYSRGIPVLNDQDFQTIKIHLKALGLTDVIYTKTVQGGMALFWNLTEYGEQQMMNLRSLKK